MQFINSKIIELDARVELVKDSSAKSDLRQEFAERLQESTLKQFKDLELNIDTDSFVPMDISKYIPVANVKLKEVTGIVTTGFIHLTIFPRMPGRGGKQKVTKQILSTSTELLNRLILELAGLTKDTEMKISMSVKYLVRRKSFNMNHILLPELLDTSNKLDMKLSMNGCSLDFKSDELSDDTNFSVRIGNPHQFEGDKEIEMVWSCNLEYHTSLKSLDFSQILDNISALSKKSATILGV